MLSHIENGNEEYKVVLMKVFVVVEPEAFPKVLLEKFRSPRRGEGGRSGRATLVFLISGEPAYAGCSEAVSGAASWCWLSWGSIAAIKNLAVALMVSRDCLS